MPKLNIDKVCVGLDYDLIPVEDSPNDQAWDVMVMLRLMEKGIASRLIL
jgi:hypothetical protein